MRVRLHVDRGMDVREGDPLIVVHANTENKIYATIGTLCTARPLVMERAILEHVTGFAD